MSGPRSIRSTRQHGITVLELMIVLAIIGGLVFLASSGLRWATRADLVEDANMLVTLMRRTSQLAMETGKVHRLVLDLEHQQFQVEGCEGPVALRHARSDQPIDDKALQDALEKARQRLAMLPPEAAAAAGTVQDPEHQTRKVAALAGVHADSAGCTPATDLTGGSQGRQLAGELRVGKGIKFREVWVQHLEDSVTTGTVSIHFFPLGSTEKAIVALGDGSSVFSILVHGLSGRIELLDEAVRNPDDHMLRNAAGDKEAER